VVYVIAAGGVFCTSVCDRYGFGSAKPILQKVKGPIEGRRTLENAEVSDGNSGVVHTRGTDAPDCGRCGPRSLWLYLYSDSGHIRGSCMFSWSWPLDWFYGVFLFHTVLILVNIDESFCVTDPFDVKGHRQRPSMEYSVYKLY